MANNENSKKVENETKRGSPETKRGSPETKRNSPEPLRRYAILQETSGEECESWYYFLKYEGNEEALSHLCKQLDSVDWYILGDLSTFDLELKTLVSEQTAREMCAVDLNHYSFHRKFDGTLKKVDLGFKPNHTNEKKMNKAFQVLGYGQIEEYIDQEDVDPALLTSLSDSESEVDSDEESTEESSSEEERKEKRKKRKGGSATEKKEESEREEKETKRGKLPGAVTTKPKVELPGFAKAKAKRNRNKKK